MTDTAGADGEDTSHADERSTTGVTAETTHMETTDDCSSGTDAAVSRRSALAVLGLAGLAGLGATGTTTASNHEVGSASNPKDRVYADEIRGVPRGGDPFEVYTAGTSALRLGIVDTDVDNMSASGNVVFGHPDNVAADGVLGGVVGGGGGEGTYAQSVYDHFGTIGGGRGNQAGTDDTDPTAAKYATVAGGAGNTAGGAYATVAGGGANDASGERATVAGGIRSTASGLSATVGGGTENDAAADETTIGGGGYNLANADYGTIGGGFENESTASHTTVGGGKNNAAGGQFATVPGGECNTADGTASLAAGRYAEAAHDHTFVWNDGSGARDADGGENDRFSSGTGDLVLPGLTGSGRVTGPRTFHVKSTGGVRFVTDSRNWRVTYIPAGSSGWSSTSTRAVKTNVEPVDPEDVLAGVESLEISRWEFTDSEAEPDVDSDSETDPESDDGAGIQHMGPMAEDFFDAFELGDSERTINSINADGVAFAAIQGLSQRLEEREERIEELEAETEALRERVAELANALADVVETGRSPATDD